MNYSSNCDGGFISEEMAAYFDRLAHDMKPYRYLLKDPEQRKQLHMDQAARAVEDRVVRAALRVAARCGDLELAAFRPVEIRSADGDPDEEAAERLAARHGFDPGRLTALRGLARSRDVTMETVIRAALKGELLQVVLLPPVDRDREG